VSKSQSKSENKSAKKSASSETNSASETQKRLYLYLHTHWDREWYQGFEAFRVNLVRCLEKVLSDLEAGRLPNFYFDGQAAVLEDATSVAPELTDRIRAQMASGKLEAGPWYVLADQMLVSGEALIRNLKSGREITTRFGTPSQIGYCPDTFGHSQDLPRILSGFGIKWAMVWRGVPPECASPVFNWQSPDGSAVLTYHLAQGYYLTAFHEGKSSDDLASSISQLFSTANGGSGKSANNHHLFKPNNSILQPVGGDHLFPPTNFDQTITSLNESLSGANSKSIEVLTTSISKYLEQVEGSIESSSTSDYMGELRDNSGAHLFERAFLLPGVLSTRLYLKRENRSAEHKLIHICEPLFSLLALEGKMKYPDNELKRAWQLLLKNHPHDSICGCSVDSVHREMLVRYEKINQILGTLEHQAAFAISPNESPLQAARVPYDPENEPNSLVVYNLSGQTSSQVVPVCWISPVNDKKAPALVQLDSSQVRDELFAAPNVVTYYKPVALNNGWVWANDIPALGHKTLAWPPIKDEAGQPRPVSVERNKLANGIIELEVTDEGSLKATVKSNSGETKAYLLKHKLRDVSDAGDSYNFDPLEGDEPTYASFRFTHAGKRGPLIGSLFLTYEIKIPEKLEPVTKEKLSAVDPATIAEHAKSSHLITHKITTEISLQAESPIVSFETTWDNRSQDHRLEVLFDTGKSVSQTQSENHFSLVERSHKPKKITLPVEPEKEAPCDRFPCQRFFIANDQLFLNCGLPEYGVEDENVSITLLRAISYLSRGALRTRGGGAGPHLPTPEANCLGPNQASYAWSPLLLSSDDKLNSPAITKAYRLADQYDGRVWACLARNENDLKDHSLISIDNPAIRVVSLAISEDHKHFTLRLLNVTYQDQTADLTLGFDCKKIEICSLDDIASEQVHGNPVSINFTANELKTLRLDPSSHL
jgi:alpha-mannosidase